MEQSIKPNIAGCTEYVDPADLPTFAGALYCSDDAGCGLFPVTVSTNFSGVYGTGDAVAAAVPVASDASPSSPSGASRRHRRLTTAAPLREYGGSKIGASVAAAYGGNHDDDDGDDRVARVRKEGGRGILTSEQDMVDAFLRRRYDAPSRWMTFVIRKILVHV